jgi:hypothetical protein
VNPQSNSFATGCLARIGLAMVIAGSSLCALILTLLVPPWVEVEARRSQGLLWAQGGEALQQRFEGYDFLFSHSKQERTEGERQPYLGAVWDVTEHRIFWPLLYGEWAMILVGAVGVYAVCSWRLRVGTSPQTTAQPSPPLA